MEVQVQVREAIRDHHKDMPLPPDFETLEEIMNMPNERLQKKPLVNVIGCIRDYQPPIMTRGKDWKCCLQLKDDSLQGQASGLKVDIFLPLTQMQNMPKIEAVSDVLLIRMIKVQWHNGQVCLLSNKLSEYHILGASKCHATPAGTTVPVERWSSYPKIGNQKPNEHEGAYALWTMRRAPLLDLPTSQEFKQRVSEASNISGGGKFSLLRDIMLNRFHDILGEVITVYDNVSHGGTVTIYLSDYTENKHLFNKVWGEDDYSGGQDGDPFDHLTPKAKKSWPGPYGKRSIQLTLWDAHAEYACQCVKPGQWVLMKNVQFGLGKASSYMEGFMRGDRQDPSRNNISIMKQSDVAENNDPRLIAAVGRKLETINKFEQQKQEILDEENNKTQPQKGGNSVDRRSKKRAARAQAVGTLNLNRDIKCQFMEILCMPVSDILKFENLNTRAADGSLRVAPFTCRKYRADVRVVDFFPSKVEGFAVGRRISEFDMLPDYSGGEDTDVAGDRATWKTGKGAPQKRWEFRFALKLEDAGSGSSKASIWVVVDHTSAQRLLDLDSAVNLCTDKQMLTYIKETLFILWGDLEEQKSAALLAEEIQRKRDNPAPSQEPSSSSPSHPVGGQPDLDSDEEMENVVEVKKEPAKPFVVPTLTPKNLPFPCCIEQYGIKEKEEDPAKADAGEGKRWKRMFRMDGVSIKAGKLRKEDGV